MLQVVVGEAWPIELQLGDGATTKFPQAQIYAAGAAVPTATLDLAHLSGGRYANTYTFLAAANYEVRFVTYTDLAHTILDTTYDIVLEDVTAQVNDLDSLPAAVLNAMVSGLYSLKQYLRVIAAAVAGKVSNAPANPVFRDIEDTSDVITGVANVSGDRTTSTITP